MRRLDFCLEETILLKTVGESVKGTFSRALSVRKGISSPKVKFKVSYILFHFLVKL